jgi:hypothetical protein
MRLAEALADWRHSQVHGAIRRAPRRFMLWAESVIGISLVGVRVASPGPDFERLRAGALVQCAKRAGGR